MLPHRADRASAVAPASVPTRSWTVVILLRRLGLADGGVCRRLTPEDQQAMNDRLETLTGFEPATDWLWASCSTN